MNEEYTFYNNSDVTPEEELFCRSLKRLIHKGLVGLGSETTQLIVSAANEALIMHRTKELLIEEGYKKI